MNEIYLKASFINGESAIYKKMWNASHLGSMTEKGFEISIIMLK